MNFLRQATAVTVSLGPFLNSTDGDTPETALTLTQADVRISKNGGAFAQKNDATALTHMEGGFYSLALNSTDTDTVGTLKLYVHESGALVVFEVFQILEEAIYDALFASSATGAMPVSPGGITSSTFGAGALTAAAIADDAITANKIATGAIDADAIASNAITSAKIASSAIGATQIASNAIAAAKIASGAITTAKFAAGAIDSTILAANSIGTSQLADGTITAAKIATDAIDADALAASAVSEIGSGVILASIAKQTRGSAQSGGSTTMVLNANDAQTDDYYNGAIVILLEGTGTAALTVAQRTRKITDYAAGSNQITVDEAWASNPGSGTRYLIVGG